jgi:hypothetical protein
VRSCSGVSSCPTVRRARTLPGRLAGARVSGFQDSSSRVLSDVLAPENWWAASTDGVASVRRQIAGAGNQLQQDFIVDNLSVMDVPVAL